MESEEEALLAVQQAGVTIIRPDKTLFSEKVKSNYEQYREDKELYNLIQEIQNTQ